MSEPMTLIHHCPKENEQGTNIHNGYHCGCMECEIDRLKAELAAAIAGAEAWKAYFEYMERAGRDASNVGHDSPGRS